MLTSIIIPCVKSDEDVALLLKDISSQEPFSDYETVVVEGLYPPGRARNEGARKAKGEMLVFLDKDIRLGSRDLLRRMLDVILHDPEAGIVIASIRIPVDSNPFELCYAREIPLCQMPIVDKPTEAGTAPGACLAIRRDLFERVGGFHEQMVRGEDSEFSFKVKKQGKKIILVPQAFYCHHQPRNFSQLIRTQVRNGLGASFVDTYFPYLNIDVAPDRFNYDLEHKGILKRSLRFIASFCQAAVKGKALLLFSKILYASSYICGRVGFFFQKIFRRPRHLRTSPASLLVTHDFPPLVSGIGTFFFHAWKGLAPAKHIILAAKAANYKEFDARHNLDVRRYFTISKFRTVRFIFLLGATLNILIRERIDLLLCGVPVSVGGIGWICKKLFSLPYVVFYYGGELEKFRKKKFLLKVLTKIIRCADGIIANSEFSSKETRFYGINVNKVSVVLPAVDAQRFSPNVDCSDLRQKWNLQGRRVLLTVSRLVRRKGIDSVLQALPALKKEFPGLAYLIVGRGPDEPYLRGLARQSGLEENVVFVGEVSGEDLPKYYNLCDIYVMPNRETSGEEIVEGFGISFLEASACAKPVIGGSSGGAQEAVKDRVTGILVDPHKLDDLTENILRLLKDKAYATTLGENGRKRALEEFCWEDRSRRIEDLLEEMRSSQKGAASRASLLRKMYYWFRDKTSKPEERGEASAGYWQDKVRQAVFGFCQPLSGSLLEVGCGEGLFLQRFRREGKGRKLWGVDFSFAQLLRARTRTAGEAVLVQADAVKLPFKAGSLDCVVCINVFLNMPREELVDSALEEMRRVCKKGARIFFDIRNQRNPLIRAKYKWVKYYDATIDASRLRLFDPTCFEKRLKKMEFEVVRHASIGFPRGRLAPIVIIEAVRQ
jgi:phosphatidyl-myo-inositol dimannoside synthase